MSKFKYPNEHAHMQARLNAIKTLGLHEHNTAEDRARALGFNWDENLYHGTNSDFHAFEKHPRYGAGTYATEDPEIADIYAMGERREGNAHPNIMPIVARGRKLTVSDLHPEDPHSGGWFRENMAKATGMPKTRRMEEHLPHHGYDRLQINDMSDLGGMQTQHMFPDPKVIRSRFAAFDPHRIEENDLHASKGGIVSMLRKHGRPVDSDLDAMRKMSNGHRVFIAHEQDEMPREIHSVSEMHGYTPDQIYTIDPKHFSRGNKVTHAHHLEIEERPL